MSYADDQSSDGSPTRRTRRSYPSLCHSPPADTSSAQLDTKFAFPLLDLPSEIILVVIAHVDERDLSPTFPTGPCPELLNLASTNRKFNELCRPLIWRTVRYTPATHFRPAAYREMRSLATFWDILRERDKAGTPLPVLALSLDEVYSHDGPLGVEHELVADEQEVALEIFDYLARSVLQVFFGKEFMLSLAGGHRLLDIIAASPTLSAVRLNQVSCWPPLLNLNERINRLAKVKTLQIMHSDPAFFQIVHVTPNLDSLLLWPSSRRIATYMDSIKTMLPQLRNLSLDSVHGASAFRKLADEILRLSYSGLTLPLEELFLEGPLSSVDFAILVSSLAHLPNLRRLALYQCRNPTPTLFDQLHKVVPQLRALTIVAGDCHEGEEWPEDLEAYLPSLSRFTDLRFFAFDRRTPTPVGQAGEPVYAAQPQLEFAALSRVGKVCSTLTETVAIVSDVSEGTTGYFARYEREKGRTRINLRLKTVNDFLISWERWVRVEED
ncbi:hypothetical protein JCM10296v2_002369 [Rhodotorula toruloides]